MIHLREMRPILVAGKIELIDMDKLRGYWSERQGLNNPDKTKSARDTLLLHGWQRSVGGTNPYQAIWARTEAQSNAADQEARSLAVHELPSARGCTYFVPNDHFAIALAVAEGTSERAAFMTAKKYLGFTESDLDTLCGKVMEAMTDAPQDPKALRERLGDAVVNFGEAGKKRGQTTSLSLALGQLQVEGKIRRVPTNGRLDNERYGYVVWEPGPFTDGRMSRDEAFVALAEAYWRWLGIARASEFQWFSGLGVKATQEILANLELAPIVPGSDYLGTVASLADFANFELPKKPNPILVSSLDSMFLLQRNPLALLDEAMRGAVASGKLGMALGSGLNDMESHAILDRGKWIGFWEYDVAATEIVYQSFKAPTKEVMEAVQKTEVYIREDIQDARAFSLDSPKSRIPRITAMRDAASPR